MIEQAVSRLKDKMKHFIFLATIILLLSSPMSKLVRVLEDF